MSGVWAGEFSYDPGSGSLDRYTDLVARGVMRLNATTTSDLGRLPLYTIPAYVSALDVLMADRAEHER